MPAYCPMKNCILLQHFDWIIFEGVISLGLFTHKIFLQKLCIMQLLLHFKWEILKTLHACLLPYEDMSIVTVV
jgi:hypothetical protein